MIHFTTINVDGEYREWSFESIDALKTEFHSDDCGLPGGDDEVVSLESDGIPLCVKNFDDIVNLYGI